MRCCTMSLNWRWRRPILGNLMLSSMMLGTAVSLFWFGSLLDIFPFSALMFCSRIVVEFVYLYRWIYTHDKYGWYTWVNWCHEHCSRDDDGLGCISDDPAKVAVLAASAPCCDGWIIIIDFLSHSSEVFVSPILGHFREHWLWEARNDFAWSGNWCYRCWYFRGLRVLYLMVLFLVMLII